MLKDATRVLVIEDEPSILDSLQRGLSYQGYAVDAARDGASGLRMAEEQPPDLVILDLMLPDVDGLEVCRRLKRGTDPAIVVLTARDQVADRVSGLDAGADDYLVKPFSFEELLARMRAVLRRRRPAEPTSIEVGDLHIDCEARQVRRGQRGVALTKTEYDLLELLARNATRVLSKEVILEHVWGYNFEGTSEPVKVFVNRVRAKLNAEGEMDLIHAVRGYGYVLRSRP